MGGARPSLTSRHAPRPGGRRRRRERPPAPRTRSIEPVLGVRTSMRSPRVASWSSPISSASDHRPDLPSTTGPTTTLTAVAAILIELAVDAPGLVVAHTTGCASPSGSPPHGLDLVVGSGGFGPPLYPDAETARERLTSLRLLSRLFGLDTPLARAPLRLACCAHLAVAARLAQLFRPDLPVAIARDGDRHPWVSYRCTLHNLLLAGGAATWLADIAVPVPRRRRRRQRPRPRVPPRPRRDPCVAGVRSYRSRIHRGATHANEPQRQ